MSESRKRARTELPIAQLLPNLLTIAAISAGLTAILSAFQGDFERAVLLILLAGVIDGIDGRLARLLKSETPMGAELDSLADFLNFGIAPALMIYLWALQELPRAGWISVLIYAVCCVIRLARFNVSSKSEPVETCSRYFVGVPSPAGAFLAFLPMFLAFLLPQFPAIPAEIISLYVVGIGLLMISRIPTYSFKVAVIPREKVKFLFVGFGALVTALLTYLWLTLFVLGLAYIVAMALAWRSCRNSFPDSGGLRVIAGAPGKRATGTRDATHPAGNDD